MNDFLGYEKIAESLDRWRLEPNAFRSLKKAEWVVTEKIHGANFCIATDGDTVRCANRRVWLSPGESFFGYESVRDSLAANMRELFRMVQKKHSEAVHLYLYGELFGGGYPHPEVQPIAGVQPVQTGVWYAPDIRFCAFDLRLEDKEGNRRYLDYAETLKYCSETGIPAAVPIFVGKYEAAMERDVPFDSAIPRALGLPELPSGTNLAEGIVIKPYREIVITDAQGATLRPVLKRKIPQFAEDRRYHEATKWEKKSFSETAPLDLLQWEASCRIVENRLNAAASKIGYVPQRTPDKASLLFTLLVDEVMDEVQLALPESWDAVSALERKSLRLFVAGEVRSLLKTTRK